MPCSPRRRTTRGQPSMSTTGAIVPLSLSLYGLMLGIVIFLESTSYLFGSYHRSKLKKRAFSGLLGILSWWWVAASLRFVDALTGFIVPDLSEIALFETASFAILGVLGVIIAQAVNLTLFCCSRLSIRFGNSGSIFNQREIPPFTAGVNRVRSVTQPPPVARPEPPPKPLSRPQTCVSIGLRHIPLRTSAGCGPHSTHVCGAEARLMAFGRQGVNRADTEPRGSTDWWRERSVENRPR